MPLSLILIDIDFFKAYNDTRGHLVGDDCLVHVATALDTTITRGGDLMARYGGDEFAVVLQETGNEEALLLAERMRNAVAALRIDHRASGIGDCVTVSAGVATLLPTRGGAADDLLYRADRALYEAKHTGRNRVISAATAG